MRESELGQLTQFPRQPLETAALQPPHLKCICPCDGTTDIYRDLCYQGGVYHHGFLSG